MKLVNSLINVPQQLFQHILLEEFKDLNLLHILEEINNNVRKFLFSMLHC